jgi:hypothetical protein
MGIGIRLYIVEDGDSLKRIPFNRYERMLRGMPGETLPQYAGRRMRSICAAIELVNRKPTEILRLDYAYLWFDSEGKLDRSEFEKSLSLSIDLLAGVKPIDPKRKVIDASHRFAEKRYKDQFTWSPSPEIEAAIITSIFGVKP